MNDAFSDLMRALSFDRGLTKVSNLALSKKSPAEIEAMAQEAIQTRERLNYQLRLLAEEVDRLGIDLGEELAEETAARFAQTIDYLALWIQKEGESIKTIAGLLSVEIEKLLNSALGEIASDTEPYSSSALYINRADKVSAVCRGILEKSNLEFGDLIDLVDLNAACLVGINHVRGHLGHDQMDALAFNCYNACLPIDQIFGFGNNADQISSIAHSELARLAPAVRKSLGELLRFDEEALDEEEAKITIDRILNLADLLTLYSVSGAKKGGDDDPDDVINDALALYRRAERLTERCHSRIPLLVARLSEAYLKNSQRLYLEYGVAATSKILENIAQGTKVLQTVIHSDVDHLSSRLDTFSFEFKELRFTSLALMVDPNITDLRSFLVRQTFSFTEKYGGRVHSKGPWVALIQAFQNSEEDVSEGIEYLSQFARQTTSSFASERAEEAIKQLRNRINQSNELEREFRRLAHSRKPRPSQFGAFLDKYIEEVTVDSATMQEYVSISSRGMNVYGKSIIELVKFDREDGIKDAIDAEEFVAVYFSNLSRRMSRYEIEIIDRFTRMFLARGMRDLAYHDLIACCRLLEFGLAQSDDAFWYSRLIECYRQLHWLVKSVEIGSIAQKKFPNNSAILMQNAITKLRLNRHEDTILSVKQFLKENGRSLSTVHPSIRGIYAHSLAETGDRDLAEEIFRTIVSDRPTDSLARHGLANLLYEKGSADFDEAIDMFSSALRLRNKTAQVFDDRIARDCCFGISQILKEDDATKTDGISTKIENLLEALPDTHLVGLFRALGICGGLKDLLLSAVSMIESRNSVWVWRAYTQACMSVLIEDVIHSRDLSYANSLVDVSERMGTLDSLFGGAKGAYRRNLNRLISNPIAESKLLAKIDNIEPLSDEWNHVVEIVSDDSYSHNYYQRLNDALSLAKSDIASSLSDILIRIILAVSKSFKSKIDIKKIVIDRPEPRRFRTRFEDLRGYGVDYNTFYCDPVLLGTILRSFSHSIKSKSTEGVTWEIEGGLAKEERSSLVNACIRVDPIGEGWSSVRVANSVLLS